MTKGTRITLTRAQAELPLGKQLIDTILSMCHDGRIDTSEIERLHRLLGRGRSSIAAIPFLRAITRDALADGSIDEAEARV